MVADRPDQRRGAQNAKVRGGQHAAEILARQTPLFRQRRDHQRHGLDVEPVQKQDQRAHKQRRHLETGQVRVIDGGVDSAPDTGRACGAGRAH
jgi:hypothetical protein